MTPSLRPALRPLWRATYPARCPLFGRDRAYLRGPVRVLDGTINRSYLARQASGHLPLTITAQVTDPRPSCRWPSWPVGAWRSLLADLLWTTL